MSDDYKLCAKCGNPNYLCPNVSACYSKLLPVPTALLAVPIILTRTFFGRGWIKV
jgi:hypothetical protein